MTAEERRLTPEDAVDRALLFTFQLSDKDYRKMQTALSAVAFIRALEQDGYTLAALAAARRDPEPVASADAAWEALLTASCQCFAHECESCRAIARHRPIIEAAIRQSPSIDVERWLEAVSDSLAATTMGTDYAEAPEPSDEPGSPYVRRLTNELLARLAAPPEPGP